MKFHRRDKKFRPYRPPKHYDNIMVTHGHTTHTLKESKDCAFCQRVFQDFKKNGRKELEQVKENL